MNKISDIVADKLDKGLNSSCPHCQNGISWRDYNPELPDQIAKEIEDCLMPRIQRIIDALIEANGNLLTVIERCEEKRGEIKWI